MLALCVTADVVLTDESAAIVGAYVAAPFVTALIAGPGATAVVAALALAAAALSPEWNMGLGNTELAVRMGLIAIGGGVAIAGAMVALALGRALRAPAPARLGRGGGRRLAAARRDAASGHRGDRPGAQRHLHGRRRPRGPGFEAGHTGARTRRRRRSRAAIPGPPAGAAAMARAPRALLAPHSGVVAAGARRGAAADGSVRRGPRVSARARRLLDDRRPDPRPRSQPRRADPDRRLVGTPVRRRRRALRADPRQPDRPRARQRRPLLRPREHRAAHGHRDVDPRRGDRHPRRRRRARVREPGGGRDARLRDQRGCGRHPERGDPRPLRDPR